MSYGLENLVTFGRGKSKIEWLILERITFELDALREYEGGLDIEYKPVFDKQFRKLFGEKLDVTAENIERAKQYPELAEYIMLCLEYDGYAEVASATWLNKLFYFIDLDERGVYKAHIENRKEEVVWQVSLETEDDYEEFFYEGPVLPRNGERSRFGFSALKKYLQEEGVINKDAWIVSGYGEE